MPSASEQPRPRAAPSDSTFGFYTPLRYPGGKARLGPWIAETMRHNGISGGCYVEPYAGGAGAAMFLLCRGYVDRVIVNDLDPVIHAFWIAATQHAEAFAKRIESTPVTMDERARQQEVVANHATHDPLDVGFAAFFLNRTSRSGILAGGVIGGKAQTGNYKLDARFNRADLAQRVRRIGSLRRQIKVLGIDAAELLANLGPEVAKAGLVYLDPPYFNKGSQLYRNHYQADDHAEIAQLVIEAGYPLIVTYDECPELLELYQGTHFTRFSLRYSTHSGRPEAQELLFYKNLQLPEAPRMSKSLRVSSTL